MDQRVRIAVAGVVLIGGLAIALLFRHPGDQKDLPISAGGDQLLLRKQDWPAASPQAAQAPPARSAAAAPVAEGPSRTPTMLKPAETETAPPDLARVYPGSGAPATSRWGVSMSMMLPDSSRPAFHKIADGDTLAGLAERYLGSANRAMEIFEANRGVLSSPQLLPIGVELKLPPQKPPAATPPARPAERGLVPVGP
jgi:nucleoid-associated protein YgaU